VVTSTAKPETVALDLIRGTASAHKFKIGDAMFVKYPKSQSSDWASCATEEREWPTASFCILGDLGSGGAFFRASHVLQSDTPHV